MATIDDICMEIKDAKSMCFEPSNHEGEHVFRDIKVTLTPPLEDTKER